MNSFNAFALTKDWRRFGIATMLAMTIKISHPNDEVMPTNVSASMDTANAIRLVIIDARW
ncbi:hypothetical protein ACFSJQ_10675 [Vibrio olivae]